MPCRKGSNWELYSTKDIKIYYSTKPIQKVNGKVQLTLNITFSSQHESLYHIDFCITILDGIDIKPLKSRDGFIIDKKNEALHLQLSRLSHHRKKQKLELSWQGEPKSLVLPICLKYSKEKDKIRKKNLAAMMYIAWSFLVQPEKISTDQMSTIIATSTSVTKLNSKWIKISKHSLKDALELVSSCLNVELVEAVNYTATYYGKLVVNNSGVFILVKAQKGDEGRISVEIKSVLQAVSDGLMAELENVYR